MGIFRRGNKATSDELDADTSATDGQHTTSTDRVPAQAPRAGRSGGPFDRSEVEGIEGRLDLGALWLTGFPGMELRLEVEEESQNVVGVTAVLGESSVQLQAFAAPRSEGIWEDIRAEIGASITSQGGTADKTSGPLGAELRAQMPSQGADGRTQFSPVRFVGVDGPRWFLRAVISGPAAADDSAASNLLDVVRATVVVRGDEAMAPRELLSLKLPQQADAAELAAQDLAGDGSSGRGSGDDAGSVPSLDDFKPFERGPEITEIR